MSRYPRSLLLPLPPPNWGITNSHPPVSSDASQRSVAQTCVENYSGPAPSWGSVPTSPPQTTTPTGSPPWKNAPTPSDPPPPGSKSATTAPNSSSHSEVCLPLQDSHRHPPSSPFPDNWTPSKFLKVLHRPERNSPISPSIPPPLTAFSSALT